MSNDLMAQDKVLLLISKIKARYCGYSYINLFFNAQDKRHRHLFKLQKQLTTGIGIGLASEIGHTHTSVLFQHIRQKKYIHVLLVIIP